MSSHENERSPQVVESAYVKDYPIFRIREDTICLTDGKTGTYVILEAPDGCHIIAMDEDHRIALVSQYRYGVKRVVRELPSGMVEPGEDPLEAAKRELHEETGCTGGEWIALGSHSINAACQTNRNHCFLAVNVRLTHPQQLDHDERIQVEWFSLQEVLRFIETGEMIQASAICAFYHVMTHPEYRDLFQEPVCD